MTFLTRTAMPTRKRKTGAEPASNGPACGDCIWWVPDEGEPSHGYCHMAPPVPVMDGDGEAYALRPVTAGTDRACAGFSAKQ